MADNVDITPGAGKTIATDDIAGVQYQRVKVTYGTDGSATDASSTNPLPVTVPVAATSIAKAEDAAHSSGDVGVMPLTVRSDTPTAKGGTDGDYQPALTDNEGLLWVRPAPKVQRFSVTPTISTTIYASGDVLGGLQTISNAVRKSGGSGTILSILVLDKTQAQRAAMDLLIFDRSVTVAADNAAVAMSDADMANCLGVISIGPYNTAFPGTPLNSISTLINVGLPIVCNGADLYFVPVVRATPTYVATSDLTFIFTILQD